jgi:hypothetical protein
MLLERFKHAKVKTTPTMTLTTAYAGIFSCNGRSKMEENKSAGKQSIFALYCSKSLAEFMLSSFWPLVEELDGILTSRRRCQDHGIQREKYLMRSRKAGSSIHINGLPLLLLGLLSTDIRHFFSTHA